MNNRVLLEQAPTIQVVLYALVVSGRAPDDDLAAARGCAVRHGLLVTDCIVGTLPDRTDGDDPTHRRGYARALRLVADPSSPVRGLVAVSRTALSPIDAIYERELSRIADHRGGLWLVRGESYI
ncbi:hypothetical protein ABZ599_15890 [Streptomyces misionensis]|uniref:hypothetical protein n=1 Tax=Streptomyces misionensis TaxID=67331 RepID=UPI0033D2FCF7